MSVAITTFAAYAASQVGPPALYATAAIAAVLPATRIVFHPLWAWGGERLAATLAGSPAEKYLMWILAALTVASVLFVLASGGAFDV